LRIKLAQPTAVTGDHFEATIDYGQKLARPRVVR
jgi:hypothetical protein